MIITNIYFRLIFGIHVILIGIVLLKIYFDKDKDTIWGSLHRIGGRAHKRSHSADQANKIYLIMGCFSIVAGLMVILFGFRNNI